ncbi:MAG TPA: DUF418 domain-containing protein [Povalibacter sp.]
MQENPAVQAMPFTDRIAVVDVLRAFALFGIIITHSGMAFLAGPPPDPLFNTFSSLDHLASRLEELLTFGKFFTIFSFLFGLSFAIQLQNATSKGKAFAGRFTWRLILLFAIGFIHNLFFSGDILMIYAVLGLLLIPFRKVRSRTLLVIAVILVLNLPGALLGVLQVSAPPPTAEQQQAREEFGRQFEERAQRQFEIKQSGTLGEIVTMNATETMATKLMFQIFTGRLWITFGLFLLGLCAGRAQLFRDTPVNRRIFQQLLLWGGLVAIGSSIVNILYPSSFNVTSYADVLRASATSLQQASLSAFYVAAVTLLFWRRPYTGLLPQLAPLGKMGLTTYLIQSAFGLIVFYGVGFGLLGHLGIAACIGLGVLFFVAQIFFARKWMHHFNLGPVEWLWRSLTYLKVQPNIRSSGAPA